MRVAGANRFYIDPREEQTLARMSRDGEMSDSSDSLEEIPAESFKRRDAASVSRSSRVWMGYPMQRNYSPHLYNFAWAQAVLNKPLGFEVSPLGSVEIVGDGDKGGKMEPSEEVEGEAEVEGEKEEGELEEGEIGFGVELPASESNELSEEKDGKQEMEEKKEVAEAEVDDMGDFDTRVGLILEELDAITGEEVQQSFEGSCSRLRKCFESLKQIFSEERAPVVDALVQQAFMGIQTLHSVYSAGNLKNVDHAGEFLLRLLVHIKNQYHVLLSPEQLQEIDVIVQALVFKDHNKEKEMKINGDRNSVAKLTVRPGSFGSNTGTSTFLNLELPVMSRNRVLVDLHAKYDEGSLPSPTRENPQPLPILQPIGFGMGTATASKPVASKKTNAEDTKLHPYVTDAFNAVSSYQQKYSKTTFLPSNRLPSPTPSEDGNTNNDDDTRGEVSSSLVTNNASSINSGNSAQVVGSSSGGASVVIMGAQQTAPIKIVGQMSSVPNSATKTAKSRDPRLRFVQHPEAGAAPSQNRNVASVDSTTPKNDSVDAMLNPRKHKAVDNSLFGDHNLKKQRNGVSDPRNIQLATGRGGWLESNGSVSTQSHSRIHVNENLEVQIGEPGNGETSFDRRPDETSFDRRSDETSFDRRPDETSFDRRPDANLNNKVTHSGANLNPIINTAGSVPLPSFLKDIAVNPTMLVQLLKMKQQRSAAGAQQKPANAAQNPVVNRTPSDGLPGNEGFFNSSDIRQKQAEKSQMPTQTASMNVLSDTGKIRMKPRDPRRILHNNTVQGPAEQIDSSQNLSSDNQMKDEYSRSQEKGVQAWTAALPSQYSRPDIPQQFTMNLKNATNAMTSIQLTTAPLAVTPQTAAQPITNKINRIDVRPSASDSNDQKSSCDLSSEGGPLGASQALNPWGDVDHLLDGYDDQQKAAIQKERARRIEEQNKMFAARKLCLVLDLDHTLLNSAKFIEVDPVHDEILRKKEELDREKPQRHLFRFQHMGMWTKLRPGIWNFLEKASKLYELHLYTMGNKLYATEMAKVLDPTGTLFAGRVISRGDDSDPFDGDERVPKSKDLDGVLGMESAVVIIDDSIRVWPHNKLNLIVVERYTYFPCSRRQFGLLGPSLLEIDHDERPEDGTLASSLSVIERIHQNFFSNRSLNDIDVRNILAAEQRKILAGCRIVFSRVFPVGEANPHLHPLWQTAEQFGAVCTNQMDEHVTHVVANSLGTDKVNWALSRGRFVVHPGWVEASALLYRRANEQDFAVKL